MTQSPTYLSNAGHIMDTHTPVVFADDPVSAVGAIFEADSSEPVAVIERDGTFRGVLMPGSVLTGSLATAGMLASRPRMRVSPEEPAFAVVSRMLARRVEWVPVIEQGKFLGVITRRGVRAAFGETYTA
jgi:CBS domain-containing protein